MELVVVGQPKPSGWREKMFNCEFEKCICRNCDENFMNLGKCTDCCDCEADESKIVTECSMFESEDTTCN